MNLNLHFTLLLTPLIVLADLNDFNETDSTRRIVNGQVSTNGLFPSTVAILKGRGRFTYPLCGGTVVGPKAVLTAKHCLKKCSMAEVYGKYYINYGNINLKKGKNSEVIKIECFSDKHDVALLFVAEPFDVPVAEIPSHDPGSKFSECNVVGWGSHTGTATRKLKVSCTKNCVQRWTTLQVSEKDICRKKLRSMKLDEDYLDDGSQFCGLGNRTDSCQGDSGGPLFCKDKYLGIVAWGVGCAEPDIPNVNMYVPFFKNWVEKHTKVSARRMSTCNAGISKEEATDDDDDYINNY